MSADVTVMEQAALRAIVESEYQDGNPIDNAVWTKYVNPFKDRKSQSGVYASLTKKGYIRHGGTYDMGDGNGRMDTVMITAAGYHAYASTEIARLKAGLDKPVSRA